VAPKRGSRGRYLKGESGNPNGRPKKDKCVTRYIEEIGEIKDIKTGKGAITRMQGVVAKLYALALEGDIAAIKYICDRIEGTPHQSIAIEDRVFEIIPPIKPNFKKESND